MEHLEENIALTNMQCQAQAQETKAMKETLAEAAMELEVQTNLVHVTCSCIHVANSTHTTCRVGKFNVL